MAANVSRDTIFALASGALPSAIGVMRISGPNAFPWASEHLSTFRFEPRTAQLVALRDGEGNLVDRGLAIWMPGPNSYTGEDTLELMLHGGAGVIEHAMETLTSFAGIRLANPGEFTRRAFEAGKLDLTQAEGIADLIEADTRAQKDQALAQLDGALAQLYRGWRESLLRALALLDVSVDFPDEAETPETVTRPVLDILGSMEARFTSALREGEIDQRIRDGFRVAIIGAPNVGKSTLLNALARKDAAIVTAMPGTTRDIIEVRCRLAGHVVWFQDTAGIRDSSDMIEMEGVRRSMRAAEQADLRLFLSDDGASPPLGETQRDGDIFVRTKSDLHVNTLFTNEMPAISAKTGAGLAELETLIGQHLNERTDSREAPVLTRTRHRSAIELALGEIRQSRDCLEKDIGAELAGEHVRLAARAIASLVGEIGVEDVLGAVFSEFCIGK